MHAYAPRCPTSAPHSMGRTCSRRVRWCSTTCKLSTPSACARVAQPKYNKRPRWDLAQRSETLKHQAHAIWRSSSANVDSSYWLRLAYFGCTVLLKALDVTKKKHLVTIIIICGRTQRNSSLSPNFEIVTATHSCYFQKRISRSPCIDHFQHTFFILCKKIVERSSRGAASKSLNPSSCAYFFWIDDSHKKIAARQLPKTAARYCVWGTLSPLSCIPSERTAHKKDGRGILTVLLQEKNLYPRFLWEKTVILIFQPHPWTYPPPWNISLAFALSQSQGWSRIILNLGMPSAVAVTPWFWCWTENLRFNHITRISLSCLQCCSPCLFSSFPSNKANVATVGWYSALFFCCCSVLLLQVPLLFATTSWNLLSAVE